MKFGLQILATMILGYALAIFFPWWTVAIAAFLCGLIFNTKANFAAGFLGVALLWLLKAWLIDSTAAAPLSERVAAIMGFSKPILFVVTAFIGGLVGGFAAMTGSALNKPRRRGTYY
jgi:hypothetical protein